MIPYYLRILVISLLWMLIFSYSFYDLNTLIPLLFGSALSLALYFSIPIFKQKIPIVYLLIFVTMSIPFFVNQQFFYPLLLLGSYLIFEGAHYLKMIAFRILLAIFNMIVIIQLFMLDLPAHEFFLVIATLLILTFFLFSVNSIHFRFQSTYDLYENVLAEFRKLKRLAIQNEKMARLEERTKIAREMHDSVGHQLTALSMQIEMMLIKEKNEYLEEMKITVNQCLEETRKAVRALQTDEIEGISSVVYLIRKLESESHLRVHFTTGQGVLGLSLSNEYSVVLYRVLQEALTNVMKYAHSREVYVTLGKSAIGYLQFSVKNSYLDSKPIHEGFGLKNMKNRIAEIGGDLHIYQTGEHFIIEGTIPKLEGVK